MDTIPDSTATDRAAALHWLWERVLARVGQFQIDGTGRRYEIDTDDVMMREASAEDALGWLDDCDARLGCDTAHARAAMIDFIVARDGVDPPRMPADVLGPALCEATGRMHLHHPVVRGLLAMTAPCSASGTTSRA